MKDKDKTDENGFVYSFCFKNASFTKYRAKNMNVRKRILIFNNVEKKFPTFSFAEPSDLEEYYKILETDILECNMINPHSANIPTLVQEIIPFLKRKGFLLGKI